MKNGDEFSGMFLAQCAQDRQQPKGNAALLESVVHIMEKDVIVFVRRVFEQTIEIYNFKAAGVVDPTGLERGERGFAAELFPKFVRDGKRIIADAIETAGNFRNDLEKRAQMEGVVFRYAEVSLYARMLSSAICSQRNCAAISRHLIDNAL